MKKYTETFEKAITRRVHENACFIAAQHGMIEHLKDAHEQGCPWTSDVCAIAAKRGSFTCLKYAHEHKCPWDIHTCSNAARAGSLRCLQYAHEYGCPWNIHTCSNAARAGSLKCLQYAIRNGCQHHALVSKRKVSTTIKMDSTICHDYFINPLESNSYALSHTYKPDSIICTTAAQYGSLACLQYAHEHGCYWDKQTCIGAVQAKSLACLRYAREHGCPWTMMVLFSLVSGSLDCLRYVCEHDYKWTDELDTFSTVVYGYTYEHMLCLEYAFSIGCTVACQKHDTYINARILSFNEKQKDQSRVFIMKCPIK